MQRRVGSGSGSTHLPIRHSPPHGRINHQYTSPRTGHQSQSLGFEPRSGHELRPSRQQQPSHRAAGIQQRQTEYSPASTYRTYAQVVQSTSPVVAQNKAIHPSTRDSIVDGNTQPLSPHRPGLYTPSMSDETVPTLSDTQSFFEECYLSTFPQEDYSESPSEPFPSYNVASERRMLPIPPEEVGRNIRVNLDNDDQPWSSMHQRGYQDPTGPIAPHFQEMQQMDASAGYVSYASKVASSNVPGLNDLSRVQEFNRDIHNSLKNDQQSRSHVGYRQASGKSAEETYHPRPPRNFHAKQHVPTGANLQNTGTHPMARPISSRSHPSASTTSDSLDCPDPDCDARFTGRWAKGNFGRHWREWHRAGRLSYECEARGCGLFYARRDARLKHYRRHHPELDTRQPNVRRAQQSGMTDSVNRHYDLLGLTGYER